MSIGLRTFVQREGTEIRVLGYCVLEKIAKLRLLRIQRFFRVPNKSKNSVSQKYNEIGEMQSFSVTVQKKNIV